MSKNKLASTNIEETVKKLKCSQSETIQALAVEVSHVVLFFSCSVSITPNLHLCSRSQLENLWVDLSLTYRIPKSKVSRFKSLFAS